eukprot:1979003-Alexandrium_andersonii.AAC.1
MCIRDSRNRHRPFGQLAGDGIERACVVRLGGFCCPDLKQGDAGASIAPQRRLCYCLLYTSPSPRD